MCKSKFIFSIALIVPAFAFPQTSQPLSRVQVFDDLVRYEKAGYSPALSTDASYYPSDLEAATARIEAARSHMVDYGATANGNVESRRSTDSIEH
ncbi:DUF4148 domain-containing protein [Burkholderia sp. BCC1993]|uniref:DUF4148 domain-containing protein n=1 Tax=Burkholderia sp. BCC1993 TaxID=2817444 RepID=UPI002AB3072D|nr:DUF4148 domain-containing protein [Burkholderia sp. BCC1993]